VARVTTNGILLFRSQAALQSWVRLQLAYNRERRNYFVGFRDSGSHGRTFGVSFGHADWTDLHVRDIFPRVVH
jgi:hypothetical protein